MNKDLGSQKIGVNPGSFDQLTCLKWIDRVAEQSMNFGGEGFSRFQGINIIEALKTSLEVELRAYFRASTVQTPNTFKKISVIVKQNLRFYVSVGRGVIRYLAGGKKYEISTNQDGLGLIVFWPWHQSHTKVQIPVASILRDEGWDCVFITEQEDLLAEARVAGFQAWDGLGKWRYDIFRAEWAGAKLCEKWRRIDNGDLPKMNGKTVSRAVCDGVVSAFEKYATLVFRTIMAAKNLFAYMPPDIVVVGNDLTMVGRSVALVAQRLGIPSVSIMHGSIHGNQMEAQHIVNRFLVFGSLDKSFIEELGVPSEKIAICGAPYIQSLPHKHVDGKAGKATCTEGKKAILVATSGPGYSASEAGHRAVIEAIHQASKQCQHLQFTVKLHKKDRLSYYKEIFDLSNIENVRIFSHEHSTELGDIFEWLDKADILITGSSSVALEAMLTGVPVITIDLKDELKGVGFIDQGCTSHITGKDDLAAEIDHIYADADYRQSLINKGKRYAEGVYSFFGKEAAIKAASFITSEIHKGSH